MRSVPRRDVLRGALGWASLGALAACSRAGPGPGSTGPLPTQAPLTPRPGQRVLERTLTAGPVTMDLGGPRVATWAYGDTVPGRLLRARAGDLLRIRLDNRLPADTSVHWHGVALRFPSDGVPGLTQPPIAAGTAYTYEFTVPDPGTYFFHPHTGVQLDRGLYAPLVVEDPAEPGGYDAEWVVVVDDWVDGTGRTPDDVLADLVARGGDGGGMGGMDHGSMGGGMGMGGQQGLTGDVDYPYYLVNGRVPAAPEVFRARPGARVRIRLVNAASDTIFRVALGGHRFTVVASDGFAVEPAETDALWIGMGERYDLLVTLGDGVFPLTAVPAGKKDATAARALVRTGSGAAPLPGYEPSELAGRTLLGAADLRPAEGARLPERRPDAAATLTLAGQMSPYRWTINGAVFGEHTPVEVTEGQRLRLSLRNSSMMAHPFHLHGHTFGLVGSGLRKDTVVLAPMQRIDVDVEADNAGVWAAHCHNIYHAEAGMMTTLEYRA